jgi:ABC-type branched-subunit amino acid transport system substrate-binding protein
MIGVLAHRLEGSFKQCRHALASGIVLVLASVLSGCVTSTYVTADGQGRVGVIEEQTEYRTVMTPSGLRVLTPDGVLVDPNEAPAIANIQQATQSSVPRIALLLPVTGELASIGTAMKNGVDLAIKNAGISGTFEARLYDTQSTNPGALSAAREAVSEGATLILGPLRGEALPTVAQVAASRGINVVSFSNDITRVSNNAYVMGITPEAVTKRVLSYAAQQGYRRVAVVAPSDTYGLAAADAANGLARFLGTNVVLTETYPANAADRPGRTAVAQRVGEQADMFDAIYLPDTQEAGDMASLLYFYGVEPRRVRFLGVPVWDQQANDLISEQALVGAFYASPAEAKFGSFQRDYQAAYDSDPHPLSSVAYDGMSMALDIAGRIPMTRYLSNELEQPQGFSGIDGPFALRPDKRVERGMAIKRISSLGLELIEDAPTSLYQRNVTAATANIVGAEGQSATVEVPTATSTYTTTTITRTETRLPPEAGGWIGRGENRFWVPANR